MTRPFVKPELALAFVLILFSAAVEAAPQSTASLETEIDAITTSSAAPGDGTVSQEQFQRVVRVLKRTLDRVNTLEKKGGGGAASDGVVDLNSMGSADLGKPPVGTAGGKSTHQSIGVAPNFKVFFDLNLVSRPKSATPLSFENYHAYLFYEILPDAKLQFSFDVSPSPKFYELDYQVTEKVQLRAGKIWIPFDDMAPHNIFGGRVNVSRLAPSGRTYLPDIWADLGLGAKIQWVDTTSLALLSHVYVVNGLGSGGTDPAGTGAAYPSFTTTGGGSDNNRNKALGARVHALFSGMFGLGGSLYLGRWNDETTAESQNITLLGLDAQLRLNPVELRFGYSTGTVGIPTDTLGNTSFKRGGLYGELGYKFGKDQNWKILGRGGTLQLDNRAISPTDQTLLGATLLRRMGPLEVSIEHSRDVKDVPGKTDQVYTNLRLVVAL